MYLLHSKRFMSGLRRIERKLRNKNYDNKTQVIIANPVIYNALGEEWKDKLQACAGVSYEHSCGMIKG